MQEQERKCWWKRKEQWRVGLWQSNWRKAEMAGRWWMEWWLVMGSELHWRKSARQREQKGGWLMRVRKK